MADEIPLIEPVVGAEELENIEDVLDSGYMTQGPYADELESRFADRVGVDHAITVTSCTTGMELALEALGVGPGDEVPVPDFTHPATANAVVRVGAEPVLVDVDRRTYNADPAAMRAAITEDTGALLPVAWGGQPLDPDPYHEMAARHDIPILEDAACSAGVTYDGDPVGSQFDASVFSFHPRKVMATGEGGVVTTDGDELAREMRTIKNFGTVPGEDVGFVRADATNLRFSDVLAAIGVAQVERLDEIVARRRELARTYDDLLTGTEGVVTPYVLDGAEHNYQCYCIIVEAGDETLRDRLIGALAEAGIESQIGTYALHRTEAFADAARVGELVVSDELHDDLLTLPMSHPMTTSDQERVVETLTAAIDDLQ